MAVIAAGALVTTLALTDTGDHSEKSPFVATPGALQWAPPQLRHPDTIYITSSTHKLSLDDSTDYRLVLPGHPVTLDGGLTVDGGHNVVLIGGTIAVPSASAAAAPVERRGVYLKGQTGVVHIEGVQLTGDLSEGFDLDERLNATVQIENVTVDTIHGSYGTNHADVIQTWAGPARLRVDGLRASSGYQGLFLLPNQHYDGPEPESFDVVRSVIKMQQGSGYAVWTPPSSPWLHAAGLVIVDQDSDRGQVLWPADQLATINVVPPGSLQESEVDLPAGAPGVGYSSPGYRVAATP